MEEGEPNKSEQIDRDHERSNLLEKGRAPLQVVQGRAYEEENDAADAEEQPLVRNIVGVRVLDGPGGLLACVTLILVRDTEVSEDSDGEY